MLQKGPPGGGLWQTLSPFKSPYGNARRNLGLMNGEKRECPPLRIEKRRPAGEVEIVRWKEDDSGFVADDH